MLSESLSGVTDPAMRVQQLLWLNNKMRLSLRNLHALQHEKNMLKHKVNYYSPQRSSGKVMFLQVSVILLTGGCLPQCMLRCHTPPPPGSRHPPEADTPPPQKHTPPRSRPPLEADPPPHKACWEIRSTHGRYASYWDAFLFYVYLVRKRISDFTWCTLKLGNLQSSNI